MLPLRRIVCPTDFSPAAANGIAGATELSRHFQAELVLVHVLPVLPAVPSDPNFTFEVPEYERALHADAERRLAALAADLGAHGTAVRTAIGHGDAGAEIVRLAADEAADLIVIATHGTTGWRHAMFGSVAEKVVRLARRPVLTIPAQQV
jgi:nucleotide-binding universal stress UspA family protein